MKKETSSGANMAETYAKHPVIRAFVKLVPGGGALDGLVAYRADEVKKSRTLDFFDELAKGGIELSEDLVQQEEFLHCFFKTLEAAQRSYRKEKRVMFAKILKGSISGNAFSGIDQFEELVDDLNMLSAREIAALTLLRQYQSETPMPSDPPGRMAEESDRVIAFWPAYAKEVCTTLSIAIDELPPFLSRIGRTSLYVELNLNLWGDTPPYGRTTPQFDKLCRMIA